MIEGQRRVEEKGRGGKGDVQVLRENVSGGQRRDTSMEQEVNEWIQTTRWHSQGQRPGIKSGIYVRELQTAWMEEIEKIQATEFTAL